MLISKHPSEFFYEILQESRIENKLNTSDDTHTYLLHLLSSLISNQTRFHFENPLSLIFLEAHQSKNIESLQLVGDSCLILLGLFPSRPFNKKLYYSIGEASYKAASVKNNIYDLLSQEFKMIVDLLIGMKIILSSSTKDLCDLWFVTENNTVEEKLRSNHIIPIKVN